MANFLKYSIRKIDGQHNLFDENGNQVSCNVIEAKDEVYFTIWGVFKYSKTNNKRFPLSLTSIVFDGRYLWNNLKNVIVFEQNGCYGWKNQNGDLIMPPIFKQIEICDNFVWACYSNRELFVYKNGSLSEQPKLDTTFYKNGKIGLNNPDGSVFFPAIYDEIYHWGCGCDVVYTRIGNDFHYYNSNHEEILTEYRKFDNIDDKNCPYYIFEAQSRGVLVTMQLTDTLNDPQSCVCYGQKVRLDRILKSEVEQIVKNNCEVWNFGLQNLKFFDSYYTYIYSAYWAKSDSKTPIEDCINQFVKMKCYNTSWDYIIKIWLNRKTIITNSEYNKLVVHFQDLEEELFGICNPMDLVTIGYDDSLKVGEIKMFQVEYFTDRPPNEFDDIMNDALSGDVNNYIEKKQMLLNSLNQARINENWDDNYYFSEYNSFFSDNCIDSSLDFNFPLIDYLVDNENYSVKQTVFRVCQRINLFISFSSLKIDQIKSAYREIKWAISKGSCLTFVVKKKSCLDFIQGAIHSLSESGEKGIKTKLTILKKIEQLLLKNGALTAEQIRCQNLNPFE